MDSASCDLTLYSPAFASINYSYSQRDGQAELTWVADYIIRRFTRHRCYLAYPSSNRPDEEQRVTIEPNRQWGRADDSSNLDET